MLSSIHSTIPMPRYRALTFVSSPAAQKLPPIDTSGWIRIGPNRLSAASVCSTKQRTANATWSHRTRLTDRVDSSRRHCGVAAYRARARTCSSTDSKAHPLHARVSRGRPRPMLAVDSQNLPGFRARAANSTAASWSTRRARCRRERCALESRQRPAPRAPSLTDQRILATRCEGVSRPWTTRRPRVHLMHPSCACGAPEVKREDPPNIQDKVGMSVAPVGNRPKGSHASSSPWWRSKASVILQGEELGVSAIPGEDYGHYKGPAV